MPVQKFSSFDAFFDAFRFASMRPMVLGPAGEKWVLTSLVLNNLSIQWGQAEAKAVVEGAPRAAGVSIFLPTRTPAAWWWNGRQLDELSLMLGLRAILTRQSHSPTALQEEKSNEQKKRNLNFCTPCAGLRLALTGSTEGAMGSRTVWSQRRGDSRSRNHLCQSGGELLCQPVE